MEKKMKINKYIVITLLLFTAMSTYAQVAVIANKSVPENSITKSKLHY